MNNITTNKVKFLQQAASFITFDIYSSFQYKYQAVSRGMIELSMIKKL
jgi:hypothetical protein